MSRSASKTSATRLAGSNGFELVAARSAGEIAACGELFREYQRGLGVSLCFQGFDAELAALPGDYAPPAGRLVLALFGGRPAGCVALRPLFHRDAELKRLYVRSQHRGSGLGRLLAEHALAEARAIGYETVKLDTLPQMGAAQRLYETLGFVETAPYNDNPVSGVRFLAVDLRAGPTPAAR
jgi:ribosomal protein S18 acetylase RimI-like enzyme